MGRLGGIVDEGTADRTGVTGETAAAHAGAVRQPFEKGAAAGDMVALGGDRARRAGGEAGTVPTDHAGPGEGRGRSERQPPGEQQRPAIGVPGAETRVQENAQRRGAKAGLRPHRPALEGIPGRSFVREHGPRAAPSGELAQDPSTVGVERVRPRHLG